MFDTSQCCFMRNKRRYQIKWVLFLQLYSMFQIYKCMNRYTFCLMNASRTLFIITHFPMMKIVEQRLVSFLQLHVSYLKCNCMIWHLPRLTNTTLTNQKRQSLTMILPNKLSVISAIAVKLLCKCRFWHLSCLVLQLCWSYWLLSSLTLQQLESHPSSQFWICSNNFLQWYVSLTNCNYIKISCYKSENHSCIHIVICCEHSWWYLSFVIYILHWEIHN